MLAIRTYEDPLASGPIVVEDPRIEEETYIEIVRKSVIPCTDTVLTIAGDKALYLTKRSVYPMKGVWCLGGRIFFNDPTLEASIARCVERETGYAIESTRFRFLAMHYYSWVKTKQGDFGGKSLAATFVCEITEEEKERIAHGLIATEYESSFGVQRFDRERLVGEHVHPALINLYDDLFL